MRDLAPDIFRQRLIIEGVPQDHIEPDDIKQYLSKLSEVLSMSALIDPVTNRSDKFGEAGWIHWETSGAHFYAWERPKLFFSIDIYTCKEFNVEDAVDFTRSFFNTSEIVFKEV